jgi:hypothetical protein
MAVQRQVDWKLVVAVLAFLVSVFAGAFWRRADVVYDKRAVEIPLSDPLRKSIEDALAAAHSDSVAVAKNGREVNSSPHLPSTKLPDKLLYVDVRNVGHVPSARIRVRIVVPGEIADKQIADAGSAFGAVSQVVESNSTGELSFECQNLANHPLSRITIALWYQQTNSGVPSVEIQDTSEGPARQVSSIDDARFYLWEWAERLTVPLSSLAALIGALLTYVIAGSFRRNRPNFTAVYDPQQCGWAEGTWGGKPVMQVFATASLATSDERPIEIVRAYLKGTKPIANLARFLVATRESAVVQSFHFVAEQAVAKVGETYQGRIILVDKHNNKYESEELSLQYHGPGTAKASS